MVHSARVVRATVVVALITGVLACHNSTEEPEQVTAPLVFDQIAAGAYHNCGLAHGGGVYCWGEDDWGQLGTGEPYQGSHIETTPVKAQTEVQFTSVAGDEQHDGRSGHTCAIATDSGVYCWGSGAWGMLGDGEHGEDVDALHMNSVPTRATGIQSARQVVLGGKHTCVLDNTGAAWCVGSNHDGQIGVASVSGDCAIDSFAEPCALQFTEVSGSHRFERIVAGAYHNCGLTDAGEAWCWGMGGMGALGAGEMYTPSLPVAVSGDLRWESLAAGEFHTCGITSDGSTYCWGFNGAGALGNGESGGVEWVPVPVEAPEAFTSVYAGQDFSCALTSDGTAYCWGKNDQGQLGAASAESCDAASEAGPTSPCSTTPTPVQTTIHFTALALGSRHACGLTAQGEMYCWGDNEHGQLGTGNTVDSAEPVKVIGTP